MEFRDSLAYKVFARFQETKSQELKDTALELDDQHVEVKVGDQTHILTIGIKERLWELKGRQNQMITERSFINSAVKRYEKLRKQKSLERKLKRKK